MGTRGRVELGSRDRWGEQGGAGGACALLQGPHFLPETSSLQRPPGALRVWAALERTGETLFCGRPHLCWLERFPLWVSRGLRHFPTFPVSLSNSPEEGDTSILVGSGPQSPCPQPVGDPSLGLREPSNSPRHCSGLPSRYSQEMWGVCPAGIT